MTELFWNICMSLLIFLGAILWKSRPIAPKIEAFFSGIVRVLFGIIHFAVDVSNYIMDRSFIGMNRAITRRRKE